MSSSELEMRARARHLARKHPDLPRPKFLFVPLGQPLSPDRFARLEEWLALADQVIAIDQEIDGLDPDPDPGEPMVLDRAA